MKKLISMTDFILKNKKGSKKKYAKLLKRPLERWMFEGENKLFDDFNISDREHYYCLEKGCHFLYVENENNNKVIEHILFHFKNVKLCTPQ